VESQILAEARRLGFDAVAFARADQPLEADHERYARFVADGKHGRMSWLGEDVEARRTLDGDAILPGAKTVVCLARRYARTADDEARDPAIARIVARYARGQDYHNHLRKKVRRLAAFIRTLGPDVRARPLVDVEPLLERAWAARAGLGFIGKNGLVIVPGQGSYALLGEVVTTLELPSSLHYGTPMAERCGSCTRCLDACPTSAFDAPFVLDPRRCVSYFSIEAPGDVDDDLARRAGSRLFGCDECQSVCPFNRTAPPPLAATRPFHPLDRWRDAALADLVCGDEATFEVLTEGSPLRRAGRVGLALDAVRVARAWLASAERSAEQVRDAEATLARASSSDSETVRAAAAAAAVRP
jgi:epoxyqueuosine reductase